VVGLLRLVEESAEEESLEEELAIGDVGERTDKGALGSTSGANMAIGESEGVLAGWGCATSERAISVGASSA